MNIYKEIDKIKNNSRDFSTMSELYRAIAKTVHGMSWGIRKPANFTNKILRFRVSGHHHKGYVWINCNASDLFDIRFTTIKGRIKHELSDIFIDDLIHVIDSVVERVPEYNV